jgi:hypothetical protein
MNENSPSPVVPAPLTESLKKKLRSLMWKPEAVMRETMLIQQLRETILFEAGE